MKPRGRFVEDINGFPRRMTGKLGQGLASLTISLSLMAWPGQTGASVALSIVPAVFLALIPLLLIGRRPHA